MTRRREVLRLQFGPHPVEHIDVTGIEHRANLGQGESQELLEVADPGDPGHIGGRIEPLPAGPVAARLEQLEFLPVAQRPSGDPGQFRYFADAPLDWCRRRLGCPWPTYGSPPLLHPRRLADGLRDSSRSLCDFSVSIVVTAPSESEASGAPPPRVHEAAAPRRLATMAKSKAAWRPDLNGPAMREGRSSGRSVPPAGPGAAVPRHAARRDAESGCSRAAQRRASRPAGAATLGGLRHSARRAPPARGRGCWQRRRRGRRSRARRRSRWRAPGPSSGRWCSFPSRPPGIRPEGYS